MEEECNISLSLSIGGGKSVSIRKHDRIREQKPAAQFHILFPNQVKKEPTREEMNVLRPVFVGREEDDSGSGDTAYSHEIDGGVMRKKLRFTTEQSALLEDSFREHNLLGSKKKQELAERLHLKPRQVEVWFQNRRARTKVKQTEVDCEFLRKWCQSLSDENRRLKKELQDLKALKARPFYVRLPNATPTATCPSCSH